jgi:hypothetical protein
MVADNVKVYEAMQEGEPLAIFRKTVLSKVVVTVLDPFSDQPIALVLSGKPNDPQNEQCYVKIYTTKQLVFFNNMNKRLLETGIVIRDDNFLKKSQTLESKPYEQYTDDELYDEILSKPYGAFAKVVAKINNPVVINRLLVLAEGTNKSHKIVELLQNKLAELNQSLVENEA